MKHNTTQKAKVEEAGQLIYRLITGTPCGDKKKRNAAGAMVVSLEMARFCSFKWRLLCLAK
jgi:hypothetical protein